MKDLLPIMLIFILILPGCYTSSLGLADAHWMDGRIEEFLAHRLRGDIRGAASFLDPEAVPPYSGPLGDFSPLVGTSSARIAGYQVLSSRRDGRVYAYTLKVLFRDTDSVPAAYAIEELTLGDSGRIQAAHLTRVEFPAGAASTLKEFIKARRARDIEALCVLLAAGAEEEYGGLPGPRLTDYEREIGEVEYLDFERTDDALLVSLRFWEVYPGHGQAGYYDESIRLEQAFSGSGWLVAGAVTGERRDPAILSIATDPKGAVVFVDGERRGVTPLETLVVPGRHTITLSLPGYLTWEQSVNAGADGTCLDVALIRGDQGRLQVTSRQPGHTVKLDKVVVGVTPLLMYVEPGVYQLTVEGENGTWHGQVRVWPQGTLESLEPSDLTWVHVNPDTGVGMVRYPLQRNDSPGHPLAVTPFGDAVFMNETLQYVDMREFSFVETSIRPLHFAISPDGVRIAYTDSDGIWIADKSGANRRSLLSSRDISGQVRALIWGPGDEVTYLDGFGPGGRIHAINRIDSVRRLVYSSTGESVMPREWADGIGLIVEISGRSNGSSLDIGVITQETGRFVNLTSVDEGTQAHYLGVDTDKGIVYLESTDGVRSVWRVDVTGERTQLLSHPYLSAAWFIEDTGELYYMTDPGGGQLHVLHPDGRTEWLIDLPWQFRAGASYAYGEWSSDGNQAWLLYEEEAWYLTRRRDWQR
ncbi:MAG: PEGA domain-containing protein [Bacillota bacterium]